MVGLLITVQQDITILLKNRTQRAQNLREHPVNPAILFIQQLKQILVELDHLLCPLHIGMQPVLVDFGFNIGIFLLFLGDKSAPRIAQLLLRAVLRRLNITRQPQQALAQRFDIGLDQLQNTEALLGIEQPRHIERTLLRMQEDPLQLLAEPSGNFAGQLLLSLDIFFTRTGQEALLQLGIHINNLVLNDIGVAQPLAVLIARQRFRYAGFKGFDHRIEVDAQLAGEFLDILLARSLLEHLVHFVEQAVGQIGSHLFNRQHGRRSPDNVVFIIGRICLVHLRDVGPDVADIVMDGEFLAGGFFLAGHKVRDVLRCYVHAVVVSILQKLALGIRCGDQMAQVKWRQR
ncbi:hypothetical protein D3C75_274670 [compost metagenome]